MASFRPPKQWVLTEKETITSFANWQSNILYHLSLNNEFARFIDPTATWSKQSVANRGLANDGNDIPQDDRKTAAQKNIVLERMLGLIAQFAPSLLRSDIIKRSTSLNWIWQRIRKHYSFCQSEVNFLKLSEIRQEAGERYETLFQRIMAHLEDNLLTVDSGLLYDGAALTEDEEMSPTTERLAVYLWLSLIDQRLPSYVARVYAHDLQTKSLKDIQPQICSALESLLMELNTQEDIAVHYSQSFNKNRRRFFPTDQRSKKGDTAARTKSCVLCKASGRTSTGHDISGCWFISKFDKLQMAKALSVNTSDDVDPDSAEEEFHSVTALPATVPPPECPSTANRVQCNQSPFFYAFYKHHTVKVVIDTGATSSLISSSFVKRVGLLQQPTAHAARQVDKSSLKLSGEVKFCLAFGEIELPIDGLVTDSLDCDILAGVPFCKANNIDIHLRAEKISLNGRSIPYGSQPESIQHDVYFCQSAILRNDQSRVIFPGDFIEIASPSLEHYEGEVAVEPRMDSPLQGRWPEPAISRVIDCTIRIPNHTGEPIHVTKAQHIAQIRRVTIPKPPETLLASSTKPEPATKPSLPFSAAVTVDPDRQLPPNVREQFVALHRQLDKVFNPNFGVYNDRSGHIRAKVNFGPVIPPTRKPKLPFYNQATLQLLQEEADKLEAHGVLAKPEDIGVDVQYASPSFLVKKPDGTYRFVTAFNELGQYTRILPTSSTTCDEVLRRLSSWKYIIKTDLTKSFFQIPVSKASIPFLGTITPFKGLRVYTRSAMGMPGSSEYLQELLSRVLGDFLQQGFVIKIADDLHICGNSPEELLSNWSAVLHRLLENNLTLSAPKTIICPTTTTIVGWKWTAGQISVCSHKLSPLISAPPPSTCTMMRSYIGAYKALSRCIPKYSSLIAPLEDAIKGLQGSDKVTWTDDLLHHFRLSQEALNNPSTLTIPTPSDHLVMTLDASPVNNGISATLFVIRGNQRLPADLFSLKLKDHQQGWEPCEMEALAITAGVKHFAPYIRNSVHTCQILSDSKPCVQAYGKLLKGQFSASSRVSTFLSCLSEHNVTMCHLKGDHNKSSDYSSRHPQECKDASCQICTFVKDTVTSVVHSVTIGDVLTGKSRMPFLNTTAWKTAQHDCSALRRCFAHLTQGTRPTRKAKNVTDVRRYLNVVSLDHSGLIVVKKQDPFAVQRTLIVVPRHILPGIITALHIYFEHATKNQLLQTFKRYFYGIGSDSIVQNVVDSCSHCNSLKRLPPEICEQTSSPSPTKIGEQFAVDVIRRCSQKIFTTREVHSSFTSAMILSDEKADTLRDALLQETTMLRSLHCSIRVDNAPGFVSLKNDKTLLHNGIHLDFGRVKNPNKNPVAEKCNQEFEDELLRLDPSGKPIDKSTLSKVLQTLNCRIRNRGLSAREILFCRDQVTGVSLAIDDATLSTMQEEIRHRNHRASINSKGQKPLSSNPSFHVGDLVYLKLERHKFKAREQYIIMQINGTHAILQKLNGDKFCSPRYEVPLSQLFHSSTPVSSSTPSVPHLSSSDSDSDTEADTVDPPNDEALPAIQIAPDVPVHNPVRPKRACRQPAWLRGDEWER